MSQGVIENGVLVMARQGIRMDAAGKRSNVGHIEAGASVAYYHPDETGTRLPSSSGATATAPWRRESSVPTEQPPAGDGHEIRKIGALAPARSWTG